MIQSHFAVCVLTVLAGFVVELYLKVPFVSSYLQSIFLVGKVSMLLCLLGNMHIPQSVTPVIAYLCFLYILHMTCKILLIQTHCDCILCNQYKLQGVVTLQFNLKL